MVEAAKIVEQAQPDILDINFGCPVKRVAGKGAGAGMLQNIPKMLEITRAVVDAVKTLLTALRTGHVSIADNGNMHSRIILHFAYQCPIRLSGIHYQYQWQENRIEGLQQERIYKSDSK